MNIHLFTLYQYVLVTIGLWHFGTLYNCHNISGMFISSHYIRHNVMFSVMFIFHIIFVTIILLSSFHHIFVRIILACSSRHIIFVTMCHVHLVTMYSFCHVIIFLFMFISSHHIRHNNSGMLFISSHYIRHNVHFITSHSSEYFWHVHLVTLYSSQ